ncbi:MAG TPA: hypothetical protein ENI70_00245 [Candidatus Peregrinibacteria bacterium]|nr:hypothetical protein [Candidatus Peregrinibacteria bacterium]
MKLNSKNPKEEKDTVKQRPPQAKTASTQRFLKIAEIKDDTIVLKNGGARAVLQTSAVNFNLKSEEEQNSLVYAFQSFLNTLEHPVQILIRSKKLDIDRYIDNLKEIGEKQVNPLLQKQTLEYAEYISKLVEYADIMEKKFYVIVPANTVGVTPQKLNFIQRFLESIHPQDTVSKIFTRHKEFENLRKILSQRVNIVKQGLEGCNLRVTRLKTQELIELFYQFHNPVTSREQKISELDKIDLEDEE